MSGYREFAPPHELSPHVACFWTERTPEDFGSTSTRVLPDGCIDIVWVGEQAPFIAGPATMVDLPTMPPRAVVTGVRFRPGMAPSVLGVPAHELRDARVPLGDVWENEARGLARRVSDLDAVDARLAAVQAAVSQRLQAARPADPLVGAAASWFAQNPDARVHEVSERLGVSERQLLRRFEPAVGYGPKTFQRVARLQRWLHLTRREPTMGTADLALAAGYADQPHLGREVTRLTGVSPVALLAERRRASMPSPAGRRA
jgi:AraC-like DNA-binding protein